MVTFRAIRLKDGRFQLFGRPLLLSPTHLTHRYAPCLVEEGTPTRNPRICGRLARSRIRTSGTCRETGTSRTCCNACKGSTRHILTDVWLVPERYANKVCANYFAFFERRLRHKKAQHRFHFGKIALPRSGNVLQRFF